MAIYHCEQCNGPFQRPPSHVARHDHNFCSRACRNVWQSVNQRGEQNPNFSSIAVACEQCGRIFERWLSQIQQYKRHFCSVTCHADWKRLHVECACEQCGTSFMRKRTDVRRVKHHFCSQACWHISHGLLMRGENHPSWKGGTIQYYGPNWREQRRRARERDAYCCQGCGIHERTLGYELHVHHIVPMRSFNYRPSENDHYLQANQLDNLMCYCRACHRFAEEGTLPSVG